MRTRERREKSEGRGVRTGPLVTTRRLRAETRRHGETETRRDTQESGAGAHREQPWSGQVGPDSSDRITRAGER